MTLILALATPSPTPAAPQRPAYTVPVDDQNWLYLRDRTMRTDAWDGLKYIPLGRDAARYISLGFDVREKYEHYFNYQWDPRAASNGYLLQRYIGDADVHVNRARVFAELEDSTVSGSRTSDSLNGPNFNVTSLFGEYALGGGSDTQRAPSTFRYGRYVSSYGAGRIIDSRDGLNVRQSFQGFRDRSYAGNWKIDAFIVSPVTTALGSFNNRADRTSHLWGVYATSTAKNTLDLYYIGDQRANVLYFSGAGPEVRHTLGIRTAGRAHRLDGDVEADWQFGSSHGTTIAAYSIAGSTGYTAPVNNGVLRFGIDAGIGSGNHALHGGRINAFRAPYPSGLTFGLIRANGPENVSGFALTQVYSYKQRLTLTTKEFFYDRQSIVDGIYIPAGFPLRGPGQATDASIGKAGFAAIAYNVDRHFSISSAYARYLVGPYLQAVGPTFGVPSASISYFAILTEYKI